MLRIGAFLLVSLLSTTATLLASPAPSASDAQAAPPNRLSGTWIVVSESSLDSGKIANTRHCSFYGPSWQFQKEQLEYYYLHPCGMEERFDCGYRLDARRDPQWLDLVFVKEQEVELGRIKIEDEQMTWIRGPRVPLRDWEKAGGHFDKRPRGFDLKKCGSNRATLLVLNLYR